MSLDKLDIEILAALVEDGRLPYRAIAERTGISAPTAKSRIDKMVEKGIIEKFTASINTGQLLKDDHINALLELEVKPNEDLAVKKSLEKDPAVQTVFQTANSSILAKYLGNKEVFENLLRNLPEGVENYRTILITDETAPKAPLDQIPVEDER